MKVKCLAQKHKTMTPARARSQTFQSGVHNITGARVRIRTLTVQECYRNSSYEPVVVGSCCYFPCSFNEFLLLIYQVKSATDYSNFDHYAKDMDVPPDDLSGWDENF